MGSAKAVEVISVGVSPDDFYRVLSDYPSMPQFIDDLKDIRVDSVAGSTYTVTYFISVLGRSISYTLRLTHRSNRVVEWDLVKGDFMKMNRGKWVLEEDGPGRTRATYHIEMGFGMLVPGAVVGQLQKTGLPKMLGQFKARAEALYGGG